MPDLETQAGLGYLLTLREILGLGANLLKPLIVAYN
jgi:hypothetical protein